MLLLVVGDLLKALEARIRSKVIEIFIAFDIAADVESGVKRLLEPLKRRVSITHHRIAAGDVVHRCRRSIAKLNRPLESLDGPGVIARVVKRIAEVEPTA